MSNTVKLSIAGGLAVVVAVLVYLAFTLGVTNEAGHSNRLKRTARRAYSEGHYAEAFKELALLADSLGITDDPIILNRAHSGFQLSRRDSNQVLYKVLHEPDKIDSTYREQMAQPLAYAGCFDYYKTLAATAEDPHLASIALNQLGVISYAYRNQQALEEQEKDLNNASSYFREALVEFPENDIARYNYELIRRKIDYPEIVLQRVKSLIAQQRYKEAREYLQQAMQQDGFIKKKYEDYVTRIQHIIMIDSLAKS